MRRKRYKKRRGLIRTSSAWSSLAFSLKTTCIWSITKWKRRQLYTWWLALEEVAAVYKSSIGIAGRLRAPPKSLLLRMWPLWPCSNVRKKSWRRVGCKSMSTSYRSQEGPYLTHPEATLYTSTTKRITENVMSSMSMSAPLETSSLPLLQPVPCQSTSSQCAMSFRSKPLETGSMHHRSSGSRRKKSRTPQSSPSWQLRLWMTTSLPTRKSGPSSRRRPVSSLCRIQTSQRRR